jgi:hypothetical protein
MRLNLLKAIKNTHGNPISRSLHLVGLYLYIIGFNLIVDYTCLSFLMQFDNYKALLKATNS